MSFIDKVKTLIGVDFANQAHLQVRREEEQAARKVAMRYSRGSVSIQKGAFQTREDLNKALEKSGIK